MSLEKGNFHKNSVISYFFDSEIFSILKMIYI